MAERTRKTTSADDPEGGVLAGLPATRPNRMSKRARASTPAAKPAARKRAATKKPAAKKRAAAKQAAARKPAVEAPVVAPPTPIAEGRKPRPVRAGHPGLADRAKDRPASDRRDEDSPGVAASVVQAAGGLASVGASITGHVLKGIGKRLPRP